MRRRTTATTKRDAAMHDTTAASRTARRRGRRSPFAVVGLIAIGLLITGGAYAGITVTSQAVASNHVDLDSPATIQAGKKLFQANCSTCHGANLQGTSSGPTLINVGAAAVDFQVGTGRMPLAQSGQQALEKPPVFTETETLELAAYVASVSPGPGLPEERYLQANGDAARGAELFRVNCAMCHNVAGAGGALTQGKFAPSLVGVSPQHIYEAMLTGPQNMPVFNDENLTPQDKADIITALKTQEKTAEVGGFDLGGLGPVAEGLFIWIFGIGAVVALTVWITAKSN